MSIGDSTTIPVDVMLPNVKGEQQIEDQYEAFDMESQLPIETTIVETEVTEYLPATVNAATANEILFNVGCNVTHWFNLRTAKLVFDL